MDDDPEYDIAVTHRSGEELADGALLADAVRAVLRRHRTPRATISLILVDDTTIAGLNARHLDHQGSTDVLTFDLSREREGASAPATGVEGEIVMSVDTAAREARTRGHRVEAELALYAIHGVLHLLGYDDHDDAGAATMHEVEDAVLVSIGVGSVYRTPTP